MNKWGARHLFIVLVVLCGCGILIGFSVAEPASATEPLVFFVVRCFADQFESGSLPVLESLLELRSPRWRAVLVNTEAERPLPALSRRLAGDGRIRLSSLPAQGSFNLWDAGYPETDAAVQSILGKDFSYVVVTNGDNWYYPDFLGAALEYEHARTVDVVLVDFYARGRNGVNVLEFSNTSCLEARLEYGLCDLGAALIRRTSLRRSRRRWMDFGPVNAQDGVFFLWMKRAGWTWKRVPRCLFSHAPNPYLCQHTLGGQWWNSSASRQELASACWSAARVARERANRRVPLVESTSRSGIRVLSLPAAAHERAQQAFHDDDVRFALTFLENIRSKAPPLTRSLLKSLYGL